MFRDAKWWITARNWGRVYHSILWIKGKSFTISWNSLLHGSLIPMNKVSCRSKIYLKVIVIRPLGNWEVVFWQVGGWEWTHFYGHGNLCHEVKDCYYGSRVVKWGPKLRRRILTHSPLSVCPSPPLLSLQHFLLAFCAYFLPFLPMLSFRSLLLIPSLVHWT